MNAFWSSALANLLGTFVGAGLALLSAWWLARRTTRAREHQRLQGLLNHLSRMRALAPSHRRRGEPLSPGWERDKERCGQSVLAARDRVGRVRDDLSIYRKVFPVLDDMYEHCLQYLSAEVHQPEEYQSALMNLRQKIVEDLRRLKHEVPSLKESTAAAANLPPLV